MLMRTAMICVSALALGACGDSSASRDQQLLDRTNAYQDTIDRVSETFPTSIANAQSATGRATFTGPTAIAAGNSFDSAILIGDTELTVNFDRNTLSGRSDRLYGIDENDVVDEYSGFMTLDGRTGTGNALSVDYAGTLNGNGDRLVLDGTMIGNFKGNPGIRSIDVIDNFGVATLNGTRVGATVGIVAER